MFIERSIYERCALCLQFSIVIRWSTKNKFPVLGKAVNSFSRIGNELYLEATPNGLILRTVNDSQTAFAVMTFETGFFTDFKIDRSNSDEFCNKCKVSMKSCLSVFKNMRQVHKTSCVISPNLQCSFPVFIRWKSVKLPWTWRHRNFCSNSIASLTRSKRTMSLFWNSNHSMPFIWLTILRIGLSSNHKNSTTKNWP